MIRQLCLWKESDIAFFRYIKGYSSNCINNDLSEIDEISSCSHSEIRKLENNTLAQKITDCYKGSFADVIEKASSNNTILEKDLNSIPSRWQYLLSTPSFYIGEHLIRVC